MRLIDIKYCELHNELFFVSKNFSKKIDPKRYPGLELKYDEEEKRLIVIWQGRVGVVPDVHFYEPVNPMDVGINMQPTDYCIPENKHHDNVIPDVNAAQVETPTGHVFKGRGKGRVNENVTR
jgi:hypothetical protein